MSYWVSLLSMDEAREQDRITDEENGGVVAN